MKDPRIPPSMVIDGKPLRFCDVIRAKTLLRCTRPASMPPCYPNGLKGVFIEQRDYDELCRIFNVRR